jgi:hypothetical protein
MKKILLFGFVLIFLIGCSSQITDFESCIAAGNPAMESHPRQCAANGQTFVEQLVGGCGTVTPGLNDECCANVMKDVPHIACVGEWKWKMPEAQCAFVCDSEPVEDYKAVKYEEDDQMKRILCESDSDCSFEKLTGSYSELDLPSCSSQLSCKGGICVYSC